MVLENKNDCIFLMSVNVIWQFSSYNCCKVGLDLQVFNPCVHVTVKLLWPTTDARGNKVLYWKVRINVKSDFFM